MTKITHNGTTIDFDAAVALMDDETREALHDDATDATTEQQFFDAYCRAHKARFGTDFVVA